MCYASDSAKNAPSSSGDAFFFVEPAVCRACFPECNFTHIFAASMDDEALVTVRFCQAGTRSFLLG